MNAKKAATFGVLFLFLGAQLLVPARAQETVSETIQPSVEISLTTEERDYLAGVFRDTWNYLATFVDPATGIPYDSDKKQPATSLSNVGLYLGATAIAAETGLITREEGLARINMTLVSLDKVPDWLGFPRVWFTTRGLKPISGTEMFSYSKHVSNLIGGLELVKAVFPKELGAAADAWFAGMDFKSMYDSKTGWIKAGYDVKANNYAVGQPFGPWYYKFLASEARLISFYLVAKGFAPVSHWSALTRTVQRQGDQWFYVSNYEDGGAYMPYMAGLYIDERDTEMGVSQKNYSLAQMKQAKNAGAPVWGLSASLDTKGEYIPYGQLKNETVTPYASMLATIHFPAESVQNLRKLEELGARPAGVYRNTGLNYTAFTAENGTAKVWAVLADGDVFFLNKDGKVERLSSYVDWGAPRPVITNYDPEAMKLLLAKLGYKIDARRNAAAYIKEVTGPAVLAPGLAEALGDPQKWKDMVLLAAASGLYGPGEIKFRDGRKVPAAFLVKSGTFRPWAVATNKDVFYLSAVGKVESLKASAVPANMTDAIKDIVPEFCVDFAPALGIEPLRRDETGPATPANGCAEYVLPAYALKEGMAVGLAASAQATAGTSARTGLAVSSPGATAETGLPVPSATSTEAGLVPPSETALADLEALGFLSGIFLPAQIKLDFEAPAAFGFRDALDWKTGAVEKHYLMPSQGMGFLALANVLHDGVVWKLFAKDPDVAKGMAVIRPKTGELSRLSGNAASCYCPAVQTEPAAVSV